MLQLAALYLLGAYVAVGALSARCTADIPFCSECDSTGTKCTVCAANFYLLKNNAGCGWACNTSSDMIEGNLPNPYYVEHALACKERGYVVPTPVETCEPGYYVKSIESDRYTCDRCTYPGLDEASNHCATCEVYSNTAPRCTSCMPGWAGTMDFCNVPGDCKSGGSKVEGCTTCQTGQPTACAACESGYYLQAGNCIPAVLYPDSNAYVANCETADPKDPFRCATCVAGYGRLNTASNECSKCVSTNYGDEDSQHCAKCTPSSYSTTVYCDACMPGWTGTYSFCSTRLTCKDMPVKVDDCYTCDSEYPMRCTSCWSGSIFDPSTPYVCLPSCNLTTPGIENAGYIDHCVKCSDYDRSKCTGCELGWVPEEGDGYSSNACMRCEKAGVTDKLSDQHCATCSVTYWGSEITECTSCLDGWTSLSTFCSEQANCMNSNKPIYHCKSCASMTTCSACEDTYQLSSDKTQCLAVCNITGNAGFIPNCIQCRDYENEGNQCYVCKSGYYISSDRLSCLPCTNPELGDVNNQHCASCYESSSGGLTCDTCATEWDVPSAFCNTTYTCTGATAARVPNCVSCQTGDPALCSVCQDYYVLTSNGKKCIPMCSNEASNNPWAVEHCTTCKYEDPRKCHSCTAGYNVAQDGKVCVPEGTCSPPIPGCLACTSYNPTTCSECATGTTLVNGECHASCGGKTLDGCLVCSMTDPSKCETCGSKYIKTPEGTCCHKDCCEVRNGYVSECGGRGTCDSSNHSWGDCNCDKYANPDALITWGRCDCKSDYVLGPNGECVKLMEGCGTPVELCSKCSIYDDGRLSCSECKEGYFGTDAFCRTSLAEAHCKSYYFSTGGDCDTCVDDWELASSGGYCVPKKTCTDASKGENCAFCSSTACTQCMAGWSSPSTGCNVKCNTGLAWCTQCSPTDPTVCTACVRGPAPYCLANYYRTPCTYYQVTGYYDYEECIWEDCASADPTIFNNLYGSRNVAHTTCAGHGTCIEGGSGRSGHVCSCTPGENRDPATKCASCLSGYVLQGGKCVASSDPAECPEHCRVCDANKKCLACAEGYTDKDNNCDKACTVVGCALCDAANPDICVGCVKKASYALWVPANKTYICEPECGECESGRCVLMNNNTAGCLPWSYVGDIGQNYKVYGECSHRGTYDEEAEECICDEYAKGTDCNSCVDGAVLDTNTFKCVPDISEGCPDCATGTRCGNFHGNLICFPERCVTGAGAASAVCNNAGVCGDQDTCICDDPLMDPSTGCRSCLSGYVYSAAEDRCVITTCLEGAGLILYCTSCRTDDPSRCASCTGNYVPDLTGRRCVICGDTSTRKADGTECVCNDSTKKPNAGNICAPHNCGSIANCKRCYSGDSTLCGECNYGYYISADHRSCTACGASKVVAFDGLGCTCAPGSEPAGDDPNVCLDPICHRGSTKIPGCVSCKASNSAECYSCHGGMVYDPATKTCACPEGQAIDTDGVCSPATCKSIYNCRLCYGADSSLCGFCEPPLMPNVARTECICAPGMQLTTFGTCIIPACRVGSAAIPHCVKCNDYSTAYCASCEEPFGVNYYGTACECSGGMVESNAQTCVSPLCLVGPASPTGVPGCIVCDFAEPKKCATCAHPLILNNVTNTCDGCAAGEVPQSDGTCACPDGQERAEDNSCIDPVCKVSDDYCLMCKGAPNTATCAMCGWGHTVSSSTGKCTCAPGNTEGDDGNCIVAACLNIVPDCAICRTSSPTTCAICDGNKVPSTDGTKCVCARGYEFAEDSYTCIQPLCKEGSSKVDFCAVCTLNDNTVCHSCSHNRVLSADKKSCDCPANTEPGNDGTCIDPLCRKGATAIANCLTCSTEQPSKCMSCDKSMIPINNGAECACGSGHELIDGVCARPTCLQGSTTVPNCVRCGYVATQCIECANNMAPVDNKCPSGGLSGGAIAGIVIAVIVVVAAIVVAVVILMMRRKNGGGTKSGKYVSMQGEEMATSASV